MSYRPTRRDFLGDAAKAGVASAWKLDLSALPGSAMPAQPERRSNFDSQWKFVKGDSQGAQSPDFNDGGWKTLDLPHDWSIEGPFSEDAPGAGNGAYLPTGIGWYRKQFTLPVATRGKRVVLQFDGVYQRSEVWMNGTSLGMRPYGFTTFSYDLTEHLKPAGRTNQVAVRVDNSLQPNCRWYSGSGIYRHTWLIITDPVHLAQWGTFITTPMVSPQNAAVEITTRVLNESDRDAACELKTEILDPKGDGGAAGHQHVVDSSQRRGELPSTSADCFAGLMVSLDAKFIHAAQQPPISRAAARSGLDDLWHPGGQV
jgi:beta-galactosidase